MAIQRTEFCMYEYICARVRACVCVRTSHSLEALTGYAACYIVCSLTGVSYKEGNKWDRNPYHKSSKKKLNNMEKCAYNTAYYKWLCVMMTLRIIQ
jgi:hypothetical protein